MHTVLLLMYYLYKYIRLFFCFYVLYKYIYPQLPFFTIFYFPFSLHHVCFAKTNLVITRTEPGEGKLEYCYKSGKVMVCRRLHKENLHFPWRLFFKTKRYYTIL